jgi:dGTP triphosphohydrolase
LKKLLYLVLLPLITQVTGCIVFHSVSYEVNVNEDGTGTALLTIEDINTDATTKETIDEDVKSILEHGLKSQQFVDDLKSEGKQIISRKVVVENEKLNAIVSYEFSEISRVEGLQFDNPYYYLTIPVEDSIISTNGQVTKTVEYQRIVWDKSIKTLKFKMFSDNTNREGLTSLAPYYLKEN